MSEEIIQWASFVSRALRGERKAIDDLVTSAQKPLYVFCFHLTQNRQLAEDLSHDALLKSLSSLSQLKKHDSYLPWLKQIAKFLYLDYLKSSQNSKSHIQFDELNDNELQSAPSTSVEQIHAMRTLQLLDFEEREILILIDIQEVSYEEAAVTLGHPIGTIKSKLSRARDKYLLLYDGTNRGAHSSEFQELKKGSI